MYFNFEKIHIENFSFMNYYRATKFSILIYTFKQWNIVRCLINIRKYWIIFEKMF